MKKFKSLVEKMSKQLEEMKNGEGLGTLMKGTHTNKDGTNVFDDLSKSIEQGDSETEGGLSRFFDGIMDFVEAKTGYDLEEAYKDLLEGINKESKNLDTAVKEIGKIDNEEGGIIKMIFDTLVDLANKGTSPHFKKLLDKVISDSDIEISDDTEEALEKLGKVLVDNDDQSKQEVIDLIDKHVRRQLENLPQG